MESILRSYKLSTIYPSRMGNALFHSKTNTLNQGGEMPYLNESPTEWDINYFLSSYSGFKKEAEELIQEFSKDGLTYQWVLEHSSFQDNEDYNKLILIGMSKEFGEMKRISCFEKGY